MLTYSFTRDDNLMFIHVYCNKRIFVVLLLCWHNNARFIRKDISTYDISNRCCFQLTRRSTSFFVRNLFRGIQFKTLYHVYTLHGHTCWWLGEQWECLQYGTCIQVNLLNSCKTHVNFLISSRRVYVCASSYPAGRRAHAWKFPHPLWHSGV